MTVQLFCGDALHFMAKLADNSIDLIATDPPYFKVKMDQAWDRQWATPAAYLDWIGQLCGQWQRILKPNGSLYVFASPDMARPIADVIARSFCVLNEITWIKEEGWHKKADKETLRSYLSPWERIIFAEHYGADNIAKGEAGYAAKCDQLRGFTFEPLRAYLKGEVLRARLTTRRIAEKFQEKTGSRTVTGMAGHWLEQVQWTFPTAENYEWLRQVVNSLGRQPAPSYCEFHDAPRSRFEPGKNGHGPEYLRADYEYLRADYEDLRRPFFADKERPYTDVWTFPTVPASPGKHPCEKPLALMEHIILTSTRPGATVLDCCMGRGTTGEAADKHGRDFIGIEKEVAWYTRAAERIATAQAQMALPGVSA